MQRSRKTAVLIPVIASFILSATAGFAEPVTEAGQNSTETQQSAKGDAPADRSQGVTVLNVVRSKDNPSDIRLVDTRQPAPTPVTAAPAVPPAVQHPQEAVPAPQQQVRLDTVAQIAPEPQPQTHLEPKVQPKTAPKPLVTPAPKPVAKPRPAPRKPVVAPKPKSPAPKSAVTRPAPKPKPVAAKPNAQKQSILSKVVKTATSLVSRALSWIGTRYIWGGFSSRGVDCSGLTSLVYKSVGVKLPHSARQQYKLGRPVAKSSLSKGDLVFFNTSGPISHVGIYIGDNKFVHAANPRRGVRTDSLGSSYYSKRFAGARRYI